MIDTDVMVTPPTTTPPPAVKVDAPFMAAPEHSEKKPVPLDMGEASREQGFRLNGCR
jgi:hypothetical protein